MELCAWHHGQTETDSPPEEGDGDANLAALSLMEASQARRLHDLSGLRELMRTHVWGADECVRDLCIASASPHGQRTLATFRFTSWSAHSCHQNQKHVHACGALVVVRKRCWWVRASIVYNRARNNNASVNDTCRLTDLILSECVSVLCSKVPM